MGSAPATNPRVDQAFVRALALARRWRGALELGEAPDVKTLAGREGISHRHASRLAPLAYLAPDLVQRILDGRQPAAMTLAALTAQPLPLSWAGQRRLVARLG